MKFILDTCIIVDILQKRKPFFKDAYLLVQDMIFYGIKGYVSASSITDIHYILKKSMKNEARVRENLKYVFTLFTVVDTLGQDCYESIFSDTTDYEDAVIIEIARRLGANAIITRNIKDYQKSNIPAATPADMRKFIEVHL